MVAFARQGVLRQDTLFSKCVSTLGITEYRKHWIRHWCEEPLCDGIACLSPLILKWKTRKRNGSLSPHSYCNYKKLFFAVVVKNTLSCYLKKYSSCFVRNGTLELISPASFQGSIFIEDEDRALEIRNRIERVISRAISFGCLADFGKNPYHHRKTILTDFVQQLLGSHPCPSP